jgi:voltage-gated potassium channel Kch
MGALIAGVSISVFPYSLDVIAKIRGLRDFFVTLFFVSLGMLLTKPTWDLVGTAVVLSLVVIASRLVTIWPVSRRLGFTPRVGLLGSLYLAQTSEFGLVVALIGSPSGLDHIGRDLVSLIVLVLIITSTASTYLIQYSHRIAALVVPQATTTVPDRSLSTVLVHDESNIPILLVGCHRIGSSLIHELRQAAIDFRVVDFSQNVNEKLNRLGVPTTYGDLSHFDTLAHAGVDRARILICTISDDHLRGTNNLRLLRALRTLNPTATIIANADSLVKAEKLYEAGADYVLTPRVLMARHLVEVIAEVGAGMLEERKRREAGHLRARTEVVP